MKHASVLLMLLVTGIGIIFEASPSQSVIPLPLPPNAASTAEFKFFLAGVMDRRVGFFTENGGAFAYGCGNCSFVVGEFAITGASMDVGPGIVFKLSQDGSVLTTTCRSPTCAITISEETTGGSGWFSANVRSLKNSESLDIPTKARVLFTVKKLP